MYVYRKRVKDHSCECFPVVVSLSIALSQVKNVLFQVGLSFFPLLAVSLNLLFKSWSHHSL